MTKVKINYNLIEHETEKAYLINMPHRSSYNGFSFWFPKKLIDDNGSSLTLNVPESFIIKLTKTDRHYRVIGSDSISTEDFINELDGHTVPDSRSDDSYLIVDKPEKIDKEIKVDESLRNDI